MSGWQHGRSPNMHSLHRLIVSPGLRAGVLGVVLSCAVHVGLANAAWQNLRTGQDGLPGTRVFAVAQGLQGEIAFGTNNGVGLFDGDRWTVLRDSLPSRQVRALLQDRRGTWWFGLSPGGITRYDGQRYTITQRGPELPTDGDADVKVLLEDHRGDVWIGTAASLIRHRARGDVWDRTPTTALVSVPVQALFEDRQRRLWVGTPNGVSWTDSTRSIWHSITAAPGALERDSVNAIGEDRDGGIWFGTYDGYAYRLAPDGGWSHVGPEQGLPSRDVSAIVRDSTGVLWFGFGFNFSQLPGPAGVVRYDGRTFEAFPRVGANEIGPVLAALVDDPGNVWLATDATGVYRNDATRIEPWVSDQGECQIRPLATLPAIHRETGSNCHVAMLQDHTGALWFATADSGASRLSAEGEWSRWRAGVAGFASNTLTSLFEDRSGRLWIGTSNNGAMRFDAARAGITTVTRGSGLPDDRIVTWAQDARGDVWVGTEDGAARFDGANWVRYLHAAAPGGAPVRVDAIVEDSSHVVWLRTDLGLWSVDAARVGLAAHTVATGLPDDFVTAMLRASDGSLWVGTPFGLAQRSGAGWNVIAPTRYGGGQVRTLYEDRTGRLWVGTNFGLAFREAGAWTAFGAPQLGLGDVRQVLQDVRGRMWAAGLQGVTRWNGQSWRALSLQDGLGAPDNDRLLEDTQGRLWAAGIGGLTLIVPDRVGPQTVFKLPPPRITTSRNVTFAFGAAYGETADLTYEVSNDGRVQPRSSVDRYSMQDLSDGLHTFTVSARDWPGNDDPTPAMVTFEVDATPPQAVLASPAFGAPVRGSVAITGSTTDARYVSHRIEVRRAGAADWTLVGAGTQAIAQDTLGVWNTAGEPDGDHELRLAVVDSLGLLGTALVRVIVDNEAPFVDVTSPVLVRASEGGDVYTTGGEVHLQFSPLALDADATVSVDPVAQASVIDPGDGAQLVGLMWSLAWPGAQLRHPALLEMRTPQGESRPLAIYHEVTSGVWRRLGGAPTTPGAPYAIALEEPGRVGLFAGGAAASGSGISGVALLPRAFSPSGAFGARELSIAFTLPRAGNVAIKVYARNGRLQRTVADGAALPAGDAVFRWDGRDRDGRVLDEGLYLVTIEALGSRETRTVAVLR